MAKIGSKYEFGSYINTSILIAQGVTDPPGNQTYGLWSDSGAVRKLGLNGWHIKVYATFSISPGDPYFNEVDDLNHIYLYVKVKGMNRAWIEKNGLVYTNTAFEKAVRKFLMNQNIPGGNEVYYTEQGMQGDNYVSMEANEEMAEWFYNKYGRKLFGKRGIELVEKFRLENEQFEKSIKQTIKRLKIGARRRKSSGVEYNIPTGSNSKVIQKLKADGFTQKKKSGARSGGQFTPLQFYKVTDDRTIEAFLWPEGLEFWQI